jgi:serine/threonine protein kinase
MSHESVLSDLLNEWEVLYSQGKDIPVDELCRSRPELTPALANRIAALKRMDWLNRDSLSVSHQTGGIKRHRLPLKIGPVLLERNASPHPHYRLLRQLGRGGFGEVWSAQSPLGRVAMKFCQADIAAPHERRRVGIELAGLSRIKEARHPHILTLYHMEIVDGRTLILISELAETSLDTHFKRLRDSKPLLRRCAYALCLLRDAADALDYLQTQYGLMHLDVKPSNLLLIGDRCKVGDFGTVTQMKAVHRLNGTVSVVAHSVDGSEHITATSYASIQKVPWGEILGRGVTLFSPAGAITPYYAPPEALLGNVTCRSYDQYSLALTFCELVLGHIPFRESGCNRHLDRLHGKMDLIGLPESLQTEVRKALSPNPSERFQSSTEFVTAMRDAFWPLASKDKKAATWLVGWPIPERQRPKPLQEAKKVVKRIWKKWPALECPWSILTPRIRLIRLLDRLGSTVGGWFVGTWTWLGLHVDLLFRLALMLMFALAVAAIVKVSLDRIQPVDWGQLFGKPAAPAGLPQ